MPKSADIRLNEVVQQIVPVCPNKGAALKDAVQHELMHKFAVDPPRTALSEAIAIGGLHLGGEERRKSERVYLLALATVGGKTIEETIATKERVKNYSESQFKGLIQQLANNVKGADPGAVTRHIELAESFGYSESAEACREKALQAAIKAKRLLAQMYQGLKAAPVSPQERGRYEQWFGAMEEKRYEVVRRNVETMFTKVTSSPLKLYYRGPGVRHQPDDQPGIHYHSKDVKLHEEVGNYGAFIPGWPEGSTETKTTHVLLGSEFFARCQVKSHATDVTRMSGSGVIVHEISHAVCGTNDEKNELREVLYGPRKCRAIALADPAVAINNADSYRLFSDLYDSD